MSVGAFPKVCFSLLSTFPPLCQGCRILSSCPNASQHPEHHTPKAFFLSLSTNSFSSQLSGKSLRLSTCINFSLSSQSLCSNEELGSSEDAWLIPRRWWAHKGRNVSTYTLITFAPSNFPPWSLLAGSARQGPVVTWILLQLHPSLWVSLTDVSGHRFLQLPAMLPSWFRLCAFMPLLANLSSENG